MEKAILLTGRIDLKQESYQLLINVNYLSYFYDGSIERKLFYNEVSDDFVQRIMAEKRTPLQVGVSNGFRINPKTGTCERLGRLEESLLSQFSKMVYEKLEKHSLMILSPQEENNFD